MKWKFSLLLGIAAEVAASAAILHYFITDSPRLPGDLFSFVFMFVVLWLWLGALAIGAGLAASCISAKLLHAEPPDGKPLSGLGELGLAGYICGAYLAFRSTCPSLEEALAFLATRDWLATIVICVTVGPLLISFLYTIFSSDW